MSTTTNLSSLVLNYLTEAQYAEALANNEINANELYLTPMEDISSVTLETATLTVVGWSSNSQTVTVNGVTTTNNIMVAAADASQSTYINCEVKCSAQAANALTFTCTTTPTAAIDVNILIFES